MPGQGGIGHPFFQVQVAWPESDGLMHQEVAAGILQVEGFPQAGGKNYGEFQPFTLVHGHNPHHVFLLAQGPGLTQVAAPLPHLVDKTQEPEQPPESGGLILPGPVEQGPQVGLALAPAGQPPDKVIVARFPVNIPDQRRQGFLAGHVLPAVQPCQEMPDFFLQFPGQLTLCQISAILCRPSGVLLTFRDFCIGASSFTLHLLRRSGFPFSFSFFPGAGLNRFKEGAGRPGRPKRCQFPGIQAHQGGSKHRSQGDILERVVDDVEQGQDHFHFRSGKIACAQVHVSGNTRLTQSLQNGRCPIPGRTQQDHHIPVADGAGLFFFPVVNLQGLAAVPAHHFLNFLGDQTPFQLGFAQLLRPCQFFLCFLFLRAFYPAAPFPVNQVKLHRDRRCGKIGALVQPGFVIIVNFAHFFIHQAGKQVVDAVQDLGTAAKVLRKDDALPGFPRFPRFPALPGLLQGIACGFSPGTLLPGDIPVRISVIILAGLTGLGRDRRVFLLLYPLKAAILFLEQGRFGQAEAVDALLDIAHHEAVPPGCRYCHPLKDGFLDRIDILVLVHQDLDKLPPVIQGRLRGPGFCPAGVGMG